MGKESFKLFVRNHPNLAGYVANGTMTWQKFYEMYDMYGENSVIWDPYQETITPRPSQVRETTQQATSQTSVKQEASWKDILNIVKGVDLATVQKGIDGVQKAIGLVQNFTGKSTTKAASSYEPRPMYKYFED